MSKVHPKDHFHFQAIIHSGEYFVSPRITVKLSINIPIKNPQKITTVPIQFPP